MKSFSCNRKETLKSNVVLHYNFMRRHFTPTDVSATMHFCQKGFVSLPFKSFFSALPYTFYLIVILFQCFYHIMRYFPFFLLFSVSSRTASLSCKYNFVLDDKSL